MLRLPAEIRNRIWREAFGFTHIEIFEADREFARQLGRRLKTESHSAKWRRNKYSRGVYNNVTTRRERDESFYSIAPLLVCRQIYAEAHLMPYALNVFSFHDADALNRSFLNRIGDVNRRTLRALVVQPGFKIARPYQRSLDGVREVFVRVNWPELSRPATLFYMNHWYDCGEVATYYRTLLGAETWITQFSRKEMNENSYDEYQELRDRPTGIPLAKRSL